MSERIMTLASTGWCFAEGSDVGDVGDGLLLLLPGLEGPEMAATGAGGSIPGEAEAGGSGAVEASTGGSLEMAAGTASEVCRLSGNGKLVRYRSAAGVCVNGASTGPAKVWAASARG